MEVDLKFEGLIKIVSVKKAANKKRFCHIWKQVTDLL